MRKKRDRLLPLRTSERRSLPPDDDPPELPPTPPEDVALETEP